MKNYFLGGLLALGVFIPFFANAISPDGWVLGSPIPQSSWISNAAGSTNEEKCTTVLNRTSCDYTGPSVALRLGYEYQFGDEFWAGSQDRRFKNHCARFEEQGNYNTGDGRNGLNPGFDRTEQLKNNGYRINKNTSMVILRANSIYQINAVPSTRTPGNLYIKYVVEYANDEAANTRYQHTECYPYEISRCGDGKVDTDWFKKDPKDPVEECDEGANNGKPGSSCTFDCKKVEVKDPKCSSEYNAKSKYTDTSAEWLKRTDKLCEEGEVDTFKSTRNEGQPRSFEWDCKNSEGKKTPYVCNAKQEWCGDGVYNKDHEQCDPKDSKHTNYEDGTHKTCNEKCELVDDDAVCSSQYNGKNVYTSNSTHYLNGTASENLCNVGSLKQGTFGFNFIPGFPVYFQGNPYGPLQYKWLCENGKKTSSECTLKQYRCGDGDVNDGRNPRSFIDGKSHYEACDPKDPNSKGECGENCDYLPAICGPANSTTAVYNPNYPTSRIKENELCKTGKLKEGSFSGPDSNGNYKWECINGTKEESCVAKDLRCGDNKYQKDYEQCDPTDPNHTNWEEGTWKTCNSNCTLTGIVRNKPVCNSYFNGVHKYTEFDSTPWVKESDYLCTQGTKGGYTYSREGNKRVFKWTCSKDGYTVDCSASQTWCGDGVKNNNESCDSQDGSHQGWGDDGCSSKCEPKYGPAKCGSEYNGKKEYLDINLSWLYENTPGLCDAGTVTGFHKHIDSPIYTWQCENHGKVSNECEADQERCGDGIVQKDNESCDPENPEWKNRTDGQGCSASCEREWCGDGIVQTYLGEECDGTKGCSSQCKLVNKPTGCNEYFTRSLRLGETKVFIDTGYAEWHDRYLYHQDVEFTENHGDYNNGANPTFNWTDQLVKAGMKLDAYSEMAIIESTPYHLITPPTVRSPNNLYVEYTVWYDNVRHEYIPSRDNLYSHKECFQYEISRCGDGVIDSGYNEVCDPGSEATKKAPDGQICNDKCQFETVPAPICNSKYNGQTVENLTEGPDLCSEGNYTTGSFNFNEATNTWTWKCDNVAGVGKDCSATKKVTPKGTPDIKKTLQNKVEVKEVGQKLDWEVKVTAKGGDITDFEIWDVMPNELNYLGWDYKNGKPDGLTVTKQDKVGTSGDNKVYYWDVKGTLKEGKSLTIIVKSEVKKMPASGANILNIACVNDDGKIICDPEPVPAVCNSVYSGQTVNDLKETDNLCIIGKVTGFKFDETTNKWTWGCNNEESTVSCWAQKPSSPKGEPKIEKTLKNKVIVNAVDQKLTWTVKVTAKGGDIKDFKVRDELPKVLKYQTYRVVKNEDNLKLPEKPSGPVESGLNNIYTWNVTGTLHQGHELILEIDSIVVKMPTKEDDYLNVACVEDDNKTDCDKAKPGTAEILKVLQNKREVTETGQELDWKVTVIASGGDIENFEIWDKLPVELDYTGWKLDEANTQNGVTVTYDDNRSPKPSGDVNIHYWNVKGVLYSGNKITMIVKSTVKRMPTSGEDILNVACVVQSGNEIDCAEDNPPKPSSKGEPTIKKILQDKRQVTTTGEELVWEVKVTAKGGDIKDFEIWDIMPNEIEYKNAKLTGNTHGITITKQSKTTLTGDHNEKTVHYWSTNGKTLKKGESITMLVYTEVKVMPKAGEDILNVACVVTEETQKCDNDSTDPTKGELVPLKTLKGPKEIVNTGDEVIWSLKVTASGGNVTNFIMTDKMPPVLGYSGYKVVHTGSVDDIIFLGENKEKNTVSWKVKGTLKEGDNVEIYLTTYAKVMPDKKYDNVLCVAPEDKPDDEKCDEKPIHAPDLRIKKSFTDGLKKKTVKIGEEIAYKVTFGNSGTASATITSIKDFLPKNVDYVTGSIVINRNSAYSYDTGDVNINILRGKPVNGFKKIDGVHIEIYGGMTLEPGDKGYIILTGKVRGDFTGNTTNFACIYLNDKVIDCDDATHTVKPDDVMCKSVTSDTKNSCTETSWNASVTCETDGGKSDLIEIFCDGKNLSAKGTGEKLTTTCTYTRGNTYHPICKVNGKETDKNGKKCEGTYTFTKPDNCSSCFIAGTKVTMADRTKKNIEDVEIGEKVLGSNGTVNTVLGYDRPVLGNRHLWSINGSEYFVSDEHPFMTTEGWKSFNPEMTKLEVDLDTTELKVGDILITNNGLEEIKSVDYIDADYNTPLYNFVLDGDHTYYANNYLVHNKGCTGPCCNGGCNPTPPDPTNYCVVEEKKSNPDPLCEIPQKHCFNTNQGNFSVESGEYLPYYFNIHREKDLYNYVFKNKSDSCDLGEINLASMKCKIVIRDPKNNEVYTKENINCLTRGDTRYTNNSLIGKWADKQNELYNIDVNSARGRYWPTIDYVQTIVDPNWKSSGNLGEYKFYIYLYQYDYCDDDNNWKTYTYEEAGPESAPGCQSNFVLTDSYTVQKTPSGNLTASTETLEKFKEADGDKVSFASYLKAIATSEYHPNDTVNKAMDAFIDKYKKLAVKVDISRSKFLSSDVEVKKVPGKHIYFVEGDITVKGGNNTIDTPFTIVQTNGSTTISGNVNHNMMLLTKKDIIFSGDCETNQSVKGIFYASGNLIRDGVKKNNDLTNSVRCTQGGLNVKGVLIGKNFNNLMKDSRSHLETRFVEGNKTTKVMNGGSVVIEYSPSIFTKGAMPPGAEDFTTALSIYKN